MRMVIWLLFLATNVIQAQTKTEGPNAIEPGTLARITIQGLDELNDPKIECYPKNDQWEAVKRLDGTPVILFYTSQKTVGTFNFVIAGNKDNKTTLIVHEVTVGVSPPVPPGPIPVPPGPIPVPDGKYTTKLRSVYMVAPDNANLIKLIDVYTSMANQSGNISNYRQMATALETSVKNKLDNTTTLQPLKDAVAEILQTDLANRNSTPYDAAAAKTIFLELAKSLQPLVNKTSEKGGR